MLIFSTDLINSLNNTELSHACARSNVIFQGDATGIFNEYVKKMLRLPAIETEEAENSDDSSDSSLSDEECGSENV